MHMTVIEKQCLLCYLGYYVGKIDGVWGQMSKTATRCFQKDFGLTDDGVCGEQTEKAMKHAVCYGVEKKAEETKTGDPWDEIEYFDKAEFACKCGGRYCNGYPADIDMTMVKYADEIRRRIGKPLSVNSGLRCPIHNMNEGGVSDSQHLCGTAVDLGCPFGGVTPAKMAEIAEDVMDHGGGIGIYSWGIHIDTRKTKSRWNG